jgi:hypothetical protein
MTMGCVGRTAWSKGPPHASRATPHDEVAESSPSPKLLEHPMVVDSELPKGWRLPPFPLSRPRPSLVRRPAKGNALVKVGMLSAAEDPAHDDCSPCYSPAVGRPSRRPPLSRDGHCNRDGSRLCDPSVLRCLTLTNQAPGVARFGLRERRLLFPSHRPPAAPSTTSTTDSARAVFSGLVALPVTRPS